MGVGAPAVRDELEGDIVGAGKEEAAIAEGVGGFVARQIRLKEEGGKKLR